MVRSKSKQAHSFLRSIALSNRAGLAAEWQETAEGRRVRSYTLTRQGKRQLAVEKKTWTRIVQAMATLLGSA